MEFIKFLGFLMVINLVMILWMSCGWGICKKNNSGFKLERF